MRPLLASLLLLTAISGLGQGKSEPSAAIPVEEGRRQARELLGNLLQLQPSENASEMLLLKVTDANDATKETPVTFSIVLTPTNYLNIYETAGASGPTTRLTIAHAAGKPNEYWISQPASAPPRPARGRAS